MTTMKALTYSKVEGRPVFRNDYPLPKRGAGEALIRVRAAGICNTDLEIVKGYADFSGVMGHEFVGEITEIELNDDLKVGDRVTGEISIQCEKCNVCKKGGVRKRNHCPNHTCLGIDHKDGTFAEYLTLPVKNLHVVPSDMADESAVFTEPLAAAFRTVEQGLVSPSSKVAVIGDGKLGLLIAEALAVSDNAGVTVIGKHAEKMDLLQEGIKSHVMNDSTKAEFANCFDVVVEVSGTPDGLALAIDLTRPLGTIVLKSTCASRTSVNMAPIVVKEISVVGSRCGNFQMALDAMSEGKVKPEKFITKVCPFDDALEAFRLAGVRGTMKIVLSF